VTAQNNQRRQVLACSMPPRLPSQQLKQQTPAIENKNIWMKQVRDNLFTKREL
jgi:hypothetical protein